MVRLVDTHSHIFVKEFEDINQIMDNCLSAGVDMVLMPNIDLESIEALIETNKANPKHTRMMMGLHPSSVNADYIEVLSKIKPYLDNDACIAVGEIGLDFYWSDEFIKEQKNALEIQLQWALDADLPVSLHTRNATDETITICKNFEGLRGVFHCFGGNIEQANAIIDLGMTLGIGGVLTFKNAGLAEVVSKVDLEYLVLETDSPYLAPHPNRGKRNEPAYIEIIANKLAEIKQISLSEVASQTTQNAEKIYKFT